MNKQERIFFYCTIAAITFLFSTCSCRKSETLLEDRNASVCCPKYPELVLGNMKGDIKKGWYKNGLIEYEVINNLNVFQGDIILSDDEIVQGELSPLPQATALTKGRWPGGMVPYVLAEDISSDKQSNIQEAIDHWAKNTPIRFIKRTNEKDYVQFVNYTGCASYVGLQGGLQKIYVGDDCSAGNIIHEIGHTIGLYHEQSRIDRMTYININWDNIQEGKEFNFDVYPTGEGFQLKGLDFNSVMMYGPYSFSKNNLPTITKKDGNIYTYQRNTLSAQDIEIVNFIYKSTPGNTEPMVQINSLVDGAYFINPDIINITAYAASPGGNNITKVEFFAGDTKIGESSEYPFTYSWKNAALGSYRITAKATDASNITSVSAPINIHVLSEDPCQGVRPLTLRPS